MEKAKLPLGIQFFLKTAGAILAFTALAKLIAATGSARVLEENDPFFQFSYRLLFVFVGVLELAIAIICVIGRWPRASILLVLSLSTCFSVYRVGLWWIGWHRPCACLGNLTGAIGISPELADNAMLLLLTYLLIGSYGSQFWMWFKQRAIVEKNQAAFVR
jgi:hypothetical protein